MKRIFSPWRTKYIEGFTDEKPEVENFIIRALNSVNDKENLVLSRREFCIVLMNKYPYNNGHLLIAPNREVNEILSLHPNEYDDINNAIRDSIKVIKEVYSPHGYNLGVNAGEAAGAGLPQHLHYHIVPRWNGDANFMPTLADTKVVSVSMEDSYEKLRQAFIDLNEG